MDACTLTDRVPYAVSKTIMNTIIGPNPIGGGAFKQSLEMLGFVVGKEIVEPTWTATSSGVGAAHLYKNMYPITTPQTLLANTAGSLALKDNFPSNNAFLIQQLIDNGYFVIGKTNLSEWANFRSSSSTSIMI